MTNPRQLAIEHQAEVTAFMAIPGVDWEEVRERLALGGPDIPEPKPGPFQYLARVPYKEPLPPKQLSMWPTVEERIKEALPKIMMQRKQIKPRVKIIAKKFDLTEKEARKAYHRALEQMQLEMRREFYLDNQAYFEWEHTPEHFAYVKWWMSVLGEINRQQEKAAEKRIEDGEEHTIEIEQFDDLYPYLEIQRMGRGSYSGPMSVAAKYWLTEHDARVLWVNKRLRLVRGNENTLFNHRFITPEERRSRWDREREVPRHICSQCGADLEYNVVGFNSKMGYPDDGMLCLDCMGVDREYMESVASHYRSTGCHMFI